ncbi:hypothetical protein MKP09_14710 [Niabella ginsengisoli]|uniref:Histidine kinase n=1 Tax=Niabella ginsengisoli TaxID=522298 RepID=A0ABS9SL03_9BACT|nr:two-component regulator propeller domain-containing protein [Niabella ginsengisoli]MCH5599068.1 hypothetical protein [Niabella ginsengisoli]
MFKPITITLTACFICYIYSTAQPFYFRHYEVENGLSNNSVITAAQDKYGFMWFGTSDGLNRFDGNTFKVYRQALGKKIHFGEIRSIACMRIFTGIFGWVPKKVFFSISRPLMILLNQSLLIMQPLEVSVVMKDYYGSSLVMSFTIMILPKKSYESNLFQE